MNTKMSMSTFITISFILLLRPANSIMDIIFMTEMFLQKKIFMTEMWNSGRSALCSSTINLLGNNKL